jgi:hypothetical protein
MKDQERNDDRMDKLKVWGNNQGTRQSHERDKANE